MCIFKEIAQKSVDEFKASLNLEHDEYVNTLYVAISENNKVSCAYDSFILNDAYQCILIHCRSQMAVTNKYKWYRFEFINHRGQNLGKIIGNDCIIVIKWYGSWANQTMELIHRGNIIYSCKAPFELHMQSIWDSYCNTLNEGQVDITALKTLLAQKEERIHELEEQVSQYKQLLDGIKELIENRR